MVHTFTMQGLNLALDVESGALHILDEPAFLAVTKLAENDDFTQAIAAVRKTFNQKTADQVANEINELTDKGLLFSEKRTLDLTTDGAVKALCLHLAHECNLRCKYCFADEGHYKGARGLMPLETALSAVDFLLAASKDRRHCEIDFFGGEPLLNFSVMRDTVEYGRRKAAELGKILKFTVTTNAFDLPPDVIEYLNNEEISIVLSLDGRQQVHDRMRIRPDGSGSWQNVLKNCQTLVQGRNDNNYYLRGTYTRHNLDFCEDVKEMVRQGFTILSLEPAVLPPETKDALRFEDLPQIYNEYEKLAELLWEWESSGRKIYFFHFELDLHQGPCAKKRALGCGAGSAYLAVTPDGRLYPCHQFAGEDDFCVGHVKSGIQAPHKLTRFTAVDSAEKEACRTCFARFFCGGGCHAAAWFQNGSLHQPYALGCELHKKRVECGLYLQAKRMLAKTDR